MAPPEEIWKPVPGFEARYEVSDQGRVRSIDHWCSHRYGERKVPGKVLSPGDSKSGHVCVSLGRRNSKQVHALVMLAFVGPRPDGFEILHENHIPWDNRKTNLKYGTRSENIKADYVVGARSTPYAWINSSNGQRHKNT